MNLCMDDMLAYLVLREQKETEYGVRLSTSEDVSKFLEKVQLSPDEERLARNGAEAIDSLRANALLAIRSDEEPSTIFEILLSAQIANPEIEDTDSMGIEDELPSDASNVLSSQQREKCLRSIGLLADFFDAGKEILRI